MLQRKEYSRRSVVAGIGALGLGSTIEAVPVSGTDGSTSDPQFDVQYAPQLVRAPEAWEMTGGSPAVKVAVVDTGIDYKHSDLENQFGLPGRDYVNLDSPKEPLYDSTAEKSGTHAAGLIAAEGNNSTGIRGIADATIRADRVAGRLGTASILDVHEAITWATDQGADIINLNVKCSSDSDYLHDAIDYAARNGALPICPAGDAGVATVSYPAQYDECVAVSAIDEREQFGTFSQYGENVDVCAPGVDVLSTMPDGFYGIRTGTAVASSIVAGVAALGLAVDPGLSPRQLRDRIVETAVDIGLSDQKQGGGRIDAKNVVEAGIGSNTDPVLDGYPFESEIRALIEADVLSGYPDGTFRPERSLTRAEFATIIVIALEVDANLDTGTDPGANLSDIDGHWAETNIEKAIEAGFFTGYPDGTFRPDTDVRKLEVIIALANGLGYSGGNPSMLDAYEDVTKHTVPAWAREPIANAHAAWDGIANYPSDTWQKPTNALQNPGMEVSRLEPYRPATRAEAAKYVHDARQSSAGR